MYAHKDVGGVKSPEGTGVGVKQVGSSNSNRSTPNGKISLVMHTPVNLPSQRHSLY